jgi:hypothetical protein
MNMEHHLGSFSEALFQLKHGKRVTRPGWNGKGMWLMLTPAASWNLDVLPDASLLGIGLLPWIGMKTADNKFVPWLASQTDILAEDWMLYDDTSRVLGSNV